MRGKKLPNAVGGGLEPPTVQLATIQLWWSTPVARRRHYTAFIPYHHPRDRRARLPISTSYSVWKDVEAVSPLTLANRFNNTKVANRTDSLQIL